MARRSKDTPVDQIDPAELRYGNKPCSEQGHCDSTGVAIRYIDYGFCIGCFHRLPPGLFTHSLDTTKIRPRYRPQPKKYFTEEEKRAAASRASRRWQEKNPEKLREYLDRYAAKESTKALRRQRYLEQPIEVRQAKSRKAAEKARIKYYEKNRDKIEARKLKREQRWEEKYGHKRKKSQREIASLGSENLVAPDVPGDVGS